MPKQFDVNSVLDGLDEDVYAGQPLPDEREFDNSDEFDDEEEFEDDSYGEDWD